MTLSPTTVTRSAPGPVGDPTLVGGPMILWGPPLPRQCGRCRSMFPGDRSLGPPDTSKWWACPPCRNALFGNCVTAKLRRAEVNRQTLNDAVIGAFNDSEAYAIRYESEDESDQITASGSYLLRPDVETWGGILGDVVHDLRSALDHIAWQTTLNRHGPAPPEPLPRRDPWRRIAFPILSDSTLWDAEFEKGGHLWGVKDLKARFERHQPFTTGPLAPEREPLSMLEGLWNIDKHRCIHFARVEAAIDTIDPTTWAGSAIPVVAIDWYMDEFRTVEEAAPVARFKILAPIPAQGEVHMNSTVIAYIALEEGPPAFGEELFKVIDDVTASVREVVDEFSDELGPDAIESA